MSKGTLPSPRVFRLCESIRTDGLNEMREVFPSYRGAGLAATVSCRSWRQCVVERLSPQACASSLPLTMRVRVCPRFRIPLQDVKNHVRIGVGRNP